MTFHIAAKLLQLNANIVKVNHYLQRQSVQRLRITGYVFKHFVVQNHFAYFRFQPQQLENIPFIKDYHRPFAGLINQLS